MNTAARHALTPPALPAFSSPTSRTASLASPSPSHQQPPLPSLPEVIAAASLHEGRTMDSATIASLGLLQGLHFGCTLSPGTEALGCFVQGGYRVWSGKGRNRGQHKTAGSLRELFVKLGKGGEMPGHQSEYITVIEFGMTLQEVMKQCKDAWSGRGDQQEQGVQQQGMQQRQQQQQQRQHWRQEQEAYDSSSEEDHQAAAAGRKRAANEALQPPLRLGCTTRASGRRQLAADGQRAAAPAAPLPAADLLQQAGLAGAAASAAHEQPAAEAGVSWQALAGAVAAAPTSAAGAVLMPHHPAGTSGTAAPAAHGASSKQQQAQPQQQPQQPYQAQQAHLPALQLQQQPQLPQEPQPPLPWPQRPPQPQQPQQRQAPQLAAQVPQPLAQHPFLPQQQPAALPGGPAITAWLGTARPQEDRLNVDGFVLSMPPAGSTAHATAAQHVPAGTTAGAASAAAAGHREGSSLSLCVGEFFESSADAPGEGSKVFQLEACWLQLGPGGGAVALAKARRLYRPQQTNVFPALSSSGESLYLSGRVEERLHLARPGAVLRKCQVVDRRQRERLGLGLGLQDQQQQEGGQQQVEGGGVVAQQSPLGLGAGGREEGGAGGEYVLEFEFWYDHLAGRLVVSDGAPAVGM